MNTMKTATINLIIISLMEQEAEIKKAVQIAETRKETLYQDMLDFELLYNANWENEAIGLQLDEACDRYGEAYEEASKEEERLEAIQEAIKYLREASGILEWLES